VPKAADGATLGREAGHVATRDQAAADITMPGKAVIDASAVPEPWAVYLLNCHGGTSYVGISPRPQDRYELHRAGKGAAFTRANRPQSLAAVVWFESRSAAASMEPRLKALARPAKFAWFQRFAARSSSSPATLADGLASLARP
jgi:putative endonuclease